MKTSSFSLLAYYLFVIIYNFPRTASASSHDYTEGFLQCLSHHSQSQTSFSNITYTQNSDSYTLVLQSTINNQRFTSPSTPKPLAIVTPLYEYQVPPVMYCSRKHGLQIRVRSGGHDFEGLSYTSQVPFVVIDLINLRSIDVDVESGTAWVQSGATLIELYNATAEKSRTLAFPAAPCPTIGVGGHFSGGGFGLMQRKYGLAADNIIDARLVDVNAKILDRNSMGEDLFWAIRGGGPSFGVVLAWKVKLVPVPENVTVCVKQKTLEQNATQLLHRWQYVAPELPEDLNLGILASRINYTTQVTFLPFFLGGVDRLLPLIQKSFPELGVVKEDCTEMSWIESVSFIGGVTAKKSSFKAKSDHAKKPISVKAFEGMWKILTEEEADIWLNFDPYGGKMKKIPESALPFPHRAGNLFLITYSVYWNETGIAASQRHINWMRKLHRYMTPYVSKFPRTAYINYRDLDVGANNKGKTSYAQASVWGKKYFKNNFYRLAQVKTIVDPTNFFRNEQSIPLL